VKYKPIITKKAIIFHLYKPIYGSFYAIWEKWLKIAKERNLHIVIYTKEGKSTFTYSSYMKGAKRLERYFKNPDEPMIFWGRDFLPEVKKRQERKKKEKEILVNFFDIFSKLPEAKREAIKNRIKNAKIKSAEI